MYETINEQLKRNFYTDPVIEEMLQAKKQMVLSARQSSFVAASEVLDYYFQKLKK